MTKGQKKTAFVLALAGLTALLWIAGLLAWEFHSLTLADRATISETIWVAWAQQPGPICMCLVVLAFIAGVLFGHFFWQSWGTYEGIRRGGAGVVVFALLLGGGAREARAQASTPTPTHEPAIRLSSWTWSQVLVHADGSRVPVFGARAQGAWRTGRLLVATRVDASASKAGVDLHDVTTFDTLESLTLAAYRVVGPCSAAAAWGESVATLGQDGPRQITRFGGALCGGRDTWVLLGGGLRQAAGTGARVLGAWQVHTLGRASLVGDVAAGRGWVARLGVAVRLTE